MKRMEFKWMSLIFLIISVSIIGIAMQNLWRDSHRLSFTAEDASDLVSSGVFNWERQIPTDLDAGFGAISIFVGDANNDGYNDMVTANREEDNISIIIYEENTGNWDPTITRWVGERPNSVFIGDVNDDGFNDIVTANYNDNDTSILLWNDSALDWDPQLTRNVGRHPTSVFVADANNDTYNDIVIANELDNNISILLWNDTAKNWNPQIIYPVGSQPQGIFIGDANNDGYNDIVTPNGGDANVSILLWNTSSGDWDPQITRPAGNFPSDIHVGDVNNDGYNDIVVINTIAARISILLWNITLGDWNPRITKGGGGGFYTSVFIEDANNDGYNDIVASISGVKEVLIFLWDIITGSWETGIRIDVGGDPVGIFIGDVNSDAHNDILVANYYGGVGVLLSVPPDPTEIVSISQPDPDNEGLIVVHWEDVIGASKYYIYRNTSKITSVTGLTPIAALSESMYIDNISMSGNYYYVIVSGNAVINCSISNCENVTVAILAPLNLDIVSQLFSTEEFNINFSVYNEYDLGIDFATIQMWWDGINVSASVQNLGSGLYGVSLPPITVAPGDDPIPLNITVSATGYQDFYFEINITISSRDDGDQKPDYTFLSVAIIVAGTVIACAILVVDILRRRHAPKAPLTPKKALSIPKSE